MNTRRNAARRLEEDISNAGVPPHGVYVLPLEEDVNDEQAPVNPHPLTDENIRADYSNLSKKLLTKHKHPLLKPKL